MRYSIILYLTFMLLSGGLSSQDLSSSNPFPISAQALVEKVDFEQQDATIRVSYKLPRQGRMKNYDISLYCSLNGGETFWGPLEAVKGDIGRVKPGREKEIFWETLKDTNSLISDELVFRVRAEINQRFQTPEMVEVAGNLFQMGNEKGKEDERPTHWVRLSPFEIAKYEVTNEAFCAFLNTKRNKKEKGVRWIDLRADDDLERCRIVKRGRRYRVQSGYRKHPVIGVSWFGATAYAEWFNSRATRKGLTGWRLPTEAEWEYVATMDTLSRHGTTEIEIIPVQQTQANSLGIYGLEGNVSEWCLDHYDSQYYQYCMNQNVVENPVGPKKGSFFVVRGKNWDGFSKGNPFTQREGKSYYYSSTQVGFRLARSL